MGSILPLLTDAAFDIRATEAMGKAFDLACQTIRPGTQSMVLQEIMARRILQAARSGERDPQRLAAKAMDAVGLHLP